MEQFESFIGVNFWTALFTLLNFLALFFVAKHFLIGPVMQLIFKLAKFDVKELRNETIPETLAAIRAARAKN